MFNLRMLKVSDKLIWIAVFSLIAISMLLIFSASFNAQTKAGGDVFLYVKKQLLSLIIGLVFMAGAAYLDYNHLKKLAWPLYGAMILILLAVLFIGTTTAGAQRWLSLGPLSFQPSEVSKLILIITLATFFARREEGVNIFSALVIAGIPFLLIFKQPDLGTALVFIAISVGMLVLAKASPTLLALIFTPFFSLIFLQNIYLWGFYVVFLWGLLYFSRVRLIDMIGIMGVNMAVGIGFPYLWRMLKPYQQMRVISFLNPGLDPQGTGYHTLQSKIAIGAGGLFGRGFLKGSQTQLQFIPEQHSDFVFSVAGEEFGFLGSFLMLSLFVTLIWRCIRIADEAPDRYGSLLAAGIAVMLGFHFLISMGMTLGLLPVVGIPLPFVSFGGTSLIVNLTAIGIIQSIAMRRQKLIF